MDATSVSAFFGTFGNQLGSKNAWRVICGVGLLAILAFTPTMYRIARWITFVVLVVCLILVLDCLHRPRCTLCNQQTQEEKCEKMLNATHSNSGQSDAK